MNKIITLLAVLFSTLTLFSQGIEDIYIEEYYVSQQRDWDSSLVEFLPRNSKTYRIYADLAPGYRVQAIYGVPGQPISFESTGKIFNSRWGGFTTGDRISASNYPKKYVALDSYVTIAASTTKHIAVPRALDKDGSICKLKGFEQTDGMVSDSVTFLYLHNMDLELFDSKKMADNMYTEDAICTVLKGAMGATEENMVLLAQITTTGDLSYQFNLQLITPERKKIERYVSGNPKDEEIVSDKLKYTIKH